MSCPDDDVEGMESLGMLIILFAVLGPLFLICAG